MVSAQSSPATIPWWTKHIHAYTDSPRIPAPSSVQDRLVNKSWPRLPDSWTDSARHEYELGGVLFGLSHLESPHPDSLDAARWAVVFAGLRALAFLVVNPTTGAWRSLALAHELTPERFA